MRSANNDKRNTSYREIATCLSSLSLSFRRRYIYLSFCRRPFVATLPLVAVTHKRLHARKKCQNEVEKWKASGDGRREREVELEGYEWPRYGIEL